VPEPGVENGDRASGSEDGHSVGLLLGGVSRCCVDATARHHFQRAVVRGLHVGEVDTDLQGHPRLVAPEQPHVPAHQAVVTMPAVGIGGLVRRVDVQVGVVDVDVGRGSSTTSAKRGGQSTAAARSGCCARPDSW
jgi:hypothetical protein